MRIVLKDRLLKVKEVAEGKGEVHLQLDSSFTKEDIVVFELTEEEREECQGMVTIELDKTMVPAQIYMPSGKLQYQIPSAWKLKAYAPEAFQGNIDIRMKLTPKEVLKKRRNLALNSMDIRGEMVDYYPHADANVVTRDEPWFEARNAIDGIVMTKGHGQYPYQSWGGGLRDDLEFRLYFGRLVTIDEIVIFLRADYHEDHDINWESAVIEFSDGTSMDVGLTKTTEGQSIQFEPKKVEWIKMYHLKREISAAFSALTQFEVYGY